MATPNPKQNKINTAADKTLTGFTTQTPEIIIHTLWGE